MKQLSVLIATGIALCLTATQADAVEALTSEELKSHCDVYEEEPDGVDGIFCVRYIQGFIDGAVVTDERVTFNVADEVDRDESFTDRAIRNRVGSRLDRYGPSVYADFCLPEVVQLAEVAENVIDDLLNASFVREMPLARDLVYATLRREYPCDRYGPEE